MVLLAPAVVLTRVLVVALVVLLRVVLLVPGMVVTVVLLMVLLAELVLLRLMGLLFPSVLSRVVPSTRCCCSQPLRAHWRCWYWCAWCC